MQNIVIAEPYRFVPPHRGAVWPRLLGRVYVPRYLRRDYGVETINLHGLDRLRASFAAGHGVMLTPNHCRPCDPLLLLELARAAGSPVWAMASWHLFKQSRLQAWVLRRAGVFSIYREGLDREALRCAIDLLAAAQRPLVLFPEGVVTRANDRLIHLMEGTAFIARNAARARAASGGSVVIHPVGIRYVHDGDTVAAIAGVLADIERRLSWTPAPELAPEERIARVGRALLALKELERLGRTQEGTLAERIDRLIDHLLQPLEAEWLKGRRDAAGVVARVKALRIAIVPDLAGGELAEAERARRWAQLADLYLAQQLSLYPPDYLAGGGLMRMLETVERFEEDLTDVARIHRPMRAEIEVGEAIPVSPNRERGADGDPLMEQVQAGIEGALAHLRCLGTGP